MNEASGRGIRYAQLGVLINAALAVIKLVAGIVGNAYVLVADAVESTADILSSLTVWSGLRIASREPDKDYPFGYGKAEPLAAAVVALMLCGAAVGIAFEAVREIRTPHRTPEPWTLGVIAGVILIKWVLSRRVRAVAVQIGSPAVEADAWHHMSDAVTSAAAFVGIAIAVGGGPGWESADDWAALLVSGIIFYNGAFLLRRTLPDLMDRTPGANILTPVRTTAEEVPGVLAVEKLYARKTGMSYRVTIHVQAAPNLSLLDAHALGARVKRAIQTAVPSVQSVLVHMEPFESPGTDGSGGGRG